MHRRSNRVAQRNPPYSVRYRRRFAKIMHRERPRQYRDSKKQVAAIFMLANSSVRSLSTTGEGTT